MCQGGAWPQAGQPGIFYPFLLMFFHLLAIQAYCVGGLTSFMVMSQDITNSHAKQLGQGIKLCWMYL